MCKGAGQTSDSYEGEKHFDRPVPLGADPEEEAHFPLSNEKEKEKRRREQCPR
jgi:hypothetical protein